MKKILILVFAILVVLTLTIASICFQPLDTTPYSQTDFYKKEIAAIEGLRKVDKSNDNVEVGWAKINLLPPFTTPIAIDANRGGKHFESVRDSIYIRAFVFKQGNRKFAFISADLLIIPPSVTNLFDGRLKQQGFDNNNIFFTATHSHTSIGAWYNSFVGEIFAGKFDARVPNHIATCISKAILAAEKNALRTKIGYAEIPTSKLVFNRLVKEKGRVDSLLRVVKFENDSGETAALITFAAHATIFHEKMMQISSDWPGVMMRTLEQQEKISFASFSAGAVGSQGPYEFSKSQNEELNYMANGVSKLVTEIFDSIKTDYVTNLHMAHLPLLLREPNLRVVETLVVRPWLFYKLFGSEKVFLNTLQLGNIFFTGMPCDFSGELVSEIDSVADSKNKKLIVTSFNGGYIGYITDSKWYNLNTYETRTMGWFGPGNGNYLSEVVERMIEKDQ